MFALRLLFTLWFAAGAPVSGMAHALAGDCEHGAEHLTEALEQGSAPAPDPAHQPCARHVSAVIRPDHMPDATGAQPAALVVGQPDRPAVRSATAAHDTAEPGLTDCCSSAHCFSHLCGTSVPPVLTSSSPCLEAVPGPTSLTDDPVQSLTPGHHLQPLRPPA